METRRQQFTSAFLIVSVGLTCGILGLAFTRAGGSRAIPPLSHYGHLPDFSLIDHHQHPFSQATLAGSVWIADFIFTRCAGQCPLMSAQMAALHQALRDLPAIRFVSFSVDPVYDTPARLAAYASHYEIPDDRWRLVTESDAPVLPPVREASPITTIAHLAHDGFRLGVGADGPPEEPITHSVRLVLVDQHGSIRGYYDATDVQAMAQLQADVRRLARER